MDKEKTPLELFHESIIKVASMSEDELRYEANRILNDRQHEKIYGYSIWDDLLKENDNGED